ncbi:Nonribosomal peptide synthetase 2 [Penicillium rolfsii]|nr:Nonribosomal peptide synthetase 2 [Penicillium rolfsii]
MAVGKKAWNSLLEPPSIHEKIQDLPATLFSSIDSVTQPLLITAHESRTLQSGFLLEDEFEDNLSALIDGYARWIMATIGQERVAFWIMEPNNQAFTRCAIVIADHTDVNQDRTWKVHGISPNIGSSEADSLEFGLYITNNDAPVIKLEDSIQVAISIEQDTFRAEFIYRMGFKDLFDIPELASKLESKLKRSTEKRLAVSFWGKELKQFVGICDRKFPVIACERLLPGLSTVTQSMTLELSWQDLERSAQNIRGVSVSSFVQAAFASILAEFLELDRVILGNRTATTSDSETSPLTLVPILFSPQDTVSELISRIDDFVRRAAVVPSARLGLLRDILKISPEEIPFNAVFTHYSGHSAIKTERFDDLNSARVPIELHLHCSEDGHPTCTLRVMGELMDAPHANLLLREVDALITAMISNPCECIQNLNVDFPRSLLSIYTPDISKAIEQAPLLSPSHWVNHWTASDPDWIALEILDKIDETELVSRKWTYRELSLKSDQICSWIQSRGWQKQSIAVCLGRSFIAYALVLAIWKSGNCYVPVAEDLPETRQVFLLADSNARALFTDRALLEKIKPPEDCQVVDIDSVQLCEEEAVDGLVYPKSSPSDNCYLLYTSGSTGTPKGVLVSRGNLSAFTEAQSEYICREVPDTMILGGKGSYLAHASRAFDVHICEMVLGWRHGLRLVTGPRTMLLDNLFLVLSRLKITHAGFVPSLLEHAGVSAESLPQLRYLGVGGEKLSETIIERFVGRPSISLVNAYGPTEVTIGMTSHTVKPSSTVRNIGTAVGNITMHVLQPHSREYVKRGVPGELCVTGDLVANGYHRRPDAAGFVNFDGQRMYRTGDIVRLMANSCVEYLGRRDNQAKIRGQRLELEEVSIAVRRCASFPVNVTSIVTPSPITQRPQLVSFFTQSTGRPENVTTDPQFLEEEYQEWVPQILQRCRAELPAYMVPSVLLPLSSIPIQISGKADSLRLVALYNSIPFAKLLLEPQEKPGIPTFAPGLHSGPTSLNSDEEHIRSIISSHVEADANDIGKHTNLIQLGVDSLDLLSIAAKLRSVGYTCSAPDIFAKGTIAQLASLPRSPERSATNELLKSSRNSQSEASRKLEKLDRDFRISQKEITNSSVAIVRPCLPLQESLVLTSLGSPIPLYVNHIMLRLGSNFILEKLKMAFEDLMQENEILRTCFQITKDGAIQVVLKARIAQLPWSQVPATDENAAITIFRALQAGIASKIVERMEEKPPFHITAAASTDPKISGWIMLSVHHSIFDHATMGFFIDELYNHYTGESSTCSVDPSELYRYFVTDPGEKTRDFWTRYLSGCTPTIVNTRESDQASYEIFSKQLTFTLKKLSQFAAEHLTTTPMIIETVWAIVLAKYLGQKDVIYGRVMNGRGIPVDNVESMLIPLVTTIPGRLQLFGGISMLLEHIKSHTRSIIETFPFQHTPLRIIQRCAGAPGPLFDSLFSYLATHPRSPAEGMLREMDSVMPADYPLALEVQGCSISDTVLLRLRIAKGLMTAAGRLEDGHTFIDNVSQLLQDLILNGDVLIDAPDASRSEEIEQLEWDETTWTNAEIVIRQAIVDIVGIPEHCISKNASFFALGVDSVLSIHLARRMQESSLKITPSEILKYPTVGALSNHLSKISVCPSRRITNSTQPEANPMAINFASDESQIETYCCTPLQTAMIGECLSSQGKAYVHHHVVALVDSIDVDELVCAWQKATAEIDILRTSFSRPVASRDFHAHVHSALSMKWARCDSVVSLKAAIEEISQQSAFPDLESFSEPPWYLNFLTGESQKLMVLTMHHSLYDGFSLPMLLDCVERFYHGNEVHVKPFAPVARKIVSSQQSSVQFWKEVITGYHYPGLAPPLRSTTDPVVEWAQAKTPTLIAKLQSACGSLGITIQTLALLAFSRSLASLLDRRDILFGHVVSGRGLDTGDSASVIGPLFNTVPFRLKFESPTQNLRSALQGIQSLCLESQDHQHAPLSLIQRAWRVEDDHNGPSLFDAIFTFNKSGPPNSESIFRPYVSDFRPDIPHYRLNVEFDQTHEGLFIRATSRDLLSKTELDIWIQNMALDIDKIVTANSEALLDLPFDDRLSLVPTLEPKNSKATDVLFQDPNIGVLKSICSEITQVPVEKIYDSTNIFSLGIDSILALDITARCRKAGLIISVSDILEGQTIHGILMNSSKSVVENANPNGLGSEDALNVPEDARRKALSILSLSEGDVEAIVPCLSGQLFYISSWLRSKRSTGEFTFALRCRRKIDPASLRRAWSQLRKHHSILRTSFAGISSLDILQVILKAQRAEEESKIDVQQSSGELRSFIEELIQSDRHNPYDLFTPPVRLRLVQHDDGDVILLCLHHSLYDAWSLPILIQDLEALYERKPVSASCEFVSFVAHAIEKNKCEASKAYWNSALSRSQRTLVGKVSLTDQSPIGIHCSQGSFPRAFDMIQSQCKTAGVSVPSLILLVVGRSLARIAHVANPTFGLFQSGRSGNYPDIHKLAGPTVNMLPLVIPEALTSSPLEALSALQGDLAQRSMYDQADLYQICQMMKSLGNELQFDVIVNIVWGPLKPDVDGEDESSLFTMFPLQLPEDRTAELPPTAETSVDRFDYDASLDQHRIYLEIRYTEKGDSLQWTVDSVRDVFSAAEADALLTTLEEEMDIVRKHFLTD